MGHPVPSVNKADTGLRKPATKSLCVPPRAGGIPGMWSSSVREDSFSHYQGHLLSEYGKQRLRLRGQCRLMSMSMSSMSWGGSTGLLSPGLSSIFCLSAHIPIGLMWSDKRNWVAVKLFSPPLYIPKGGSSPVNPGLIYLNILSLCPGSSS